MALVWVCDAGNEGTATPLDNALIVGFTRTDPVPTCSDGGRWVEAIEVVGDAAQHPGWFSLDPHGEGNEMTAVVISWAVIVISFLMGLKFGAQR